MQKNNSYQLIGDRLFTARTNKKITLEEAGNKIGVNKSTIQRWENGNVEKFKIPLIEILADFYDVNAQWLMGHDVPMTINNIDVNFNTKQALPVLGLVKAGYDYLAEQNIIGYVSIDKKINDIENCYALQITGNSMQPILYQDDIIIVHKQNDVDSGQIGIILIENEEATVKKIVKYEDYIELIAFNSYYPAKKLTKDDNFKIIGKVIEARITKIFE